MTLIQNIDDTKRTDTSHDIILTLNLNEEIIQFNKESEQLTGYLREEVLDKKFSEILVPEESTKQWKDILDSIRITMWIDNFVLPIKTKNNQTYMITWTGFLVKDEKGMVKNICIFGKPLKTEIITTQSSNISSKAIPQPKEPESLPRVHRNFSDDASKEKRQQQTQELPRKHNVKKIMFAREKKPAEQPTNTPVQEQFIKSLVTLEKFVERTSQKLDLMDKSLSDLSEKYETITHRIAELEKKDQRWEKKQKNLDKHLQSVEEDNRQSTKNPNDSNLEKTVSAQQQPTDEKHTFFSDPFGFKRHNKDLSLKKQQVELRIKELESFEAQLMKEQGIFNARVEEFSRWRDKLMLLESAIETRRQELMKQEDFVLEQSTLSPTTQETHVPESVSQKSTEPAALHYDDETLDKIPESAAIIQRGILKQINNPFLELLGYTTDDIVEKSFFDFIALEGLADIEKYYLDRLKGDSVSEYKTVFSTKDDKKIPVKVNIRQTIYNGEKAEIVIVTCLDNQDSRQADEPDIKK
jgi:PAS domain S-box-containing protein